MNDFACMLHEACGMFSHDSHCHSGVLVSVVKKKMLVFWVLLSLGMADSSILVVKALLTRL